MFELAKEVILVLIVAIKNEPSLINNNLLVINTRMVFVLSTVI